MIAIDCRIVSFTGEGPERSRACLRFDGGEGFVNSGDLEGDLKGKIKVAIS